MSLPSSVVLVFSQGLFLLSSTISLLPLHHTLECIHHFLHAPLQPMELDSFFALVYQDLIFVLSGVIEYQCLFYTGI